MPKLDIKVIKKVEPIGFLNLLLYGIISGVIINLTQINLSSFSSLLLFLFTAVFFAPILADLILKLRIKMFLKYNLEEMTKSKEGKTKFQLYTIHYKINWNFEELKQKGEIEYEK